MAESVGSLVDKITIADLKLYHMEEQARRLDATDEFRAQCWAKVATLRQQKDDLAVELSALYVGIRSGWVIPKVYRQFKMYNDPQYQRTR